MNDLSDTAFQKNNDASLDNWDSWVSQLESFEKVLSVEKSTKKTNKKSINKRFTKKSKRGKGKQGASSPPLPPLPLIALQEQDDQSSTLSSGSLGRQFNSTNTSFDMIDDLNQLDERPSFQSTRSAVLAQELQFSSQQAKKRWWDPKRKEATSLYVTSDAASISEYDRERYLDSLLGGNHGDEQEFHHEHDVLEREDALNALLENSKTIMSLPLPSAESRAPSPIMSTREALSIRTESRPITAPQSPVIGWEQHNLDVSGLMRSRLKPKTSMSSIVSSSSSISRSRLLPISTPLAQLLQLSNAEELWQYVQQAKKYAATKMNKGDKRSASIALKRAQALETRWQQVLLEMVSSDGDEDDLLEDDEDAEEDDDNDSQVAVSFGAATAGAAFLTNRASTDTLRRHQAVRSFSTVSGLEEEGQDSHSNGDDEELTRRQLLVRRPTTSRSDSAPDMYSKYKINNKQRAMPGTMTTMSSSDSLVDREEEEETERAVEGLLGSEATLDQLLATTNKEHLEIYIQRLKTDTVAKARNGSKFAALQSMKNVKALQQRLVDLEEGVEDDDDEDYEDEEEDDEAEQKV